MNKSNRIIVILVILSIIFTIIGFTFAFYAWQTTEAQKTNITFTLTSDFSCSADGGGDITSGSINLVPTVVNNTTTANYIKREVKVTPTINTAGKTIYMDLWLDIKKIDSGLSNSVNFKYAFTTSSTSNTTEVVSEGTFNGKVAGNKVLLLDTQNFSATSTNTYYLWIWLDSAETDSSTMNQTFNLSLNGSCYEHKSTGAEMLIKNANPSTLLYSNATNSQKGEMWTFAHEATDQVGATTDYRYIGNVPNNYITFNNEVWRIIGVFDGRIKIIRNDTLGDIPFDYKKSGVGSSINDYGSNDWTDSQLMYMLNPTSYTLKSGYTLSGNYIKDGSGNIIYQFGCRPAEIASGATSYSCTSNTWSLNNIALSQISEVTYYLGGVSTNSGLNATDYYNFERGTTVYSGRPTNWNGLVGLMYPSDYVYTFANGVDDECYTDIYYCTRGPQSSSWLYESKVDKWTISHMSGNAYNVFHVNSSGMVSINYALISRGVRPVVYLKSDIKLQGSGMSSDPYEIVG